MRVHILQHESFESPANVLQWAKKKGAKITQTHFYKTGWKLPSPDSLDLLIIMGGPMSVHDEEKHPWLKDEKRFIKKCIVADKKILGVCLGSQLAADALGARVYKNKEKEIGWFAIRKTAARHPVSYHWPKEAMVFHWHGDTFDLPKGAIHLAESDACKHQAFIWNNQILALQCHFEVEPEHVEEFIATGKKELAAGGTYVQASAQIRAGLEHAAPMKLMLETMLDTFTD